MADYKIRIACRESMSNRGYNRSGKPTWWARVESTFAKFGQVRGDSKPNNWGTIDLPADGIYTLNTGVGKGKDGVRDEDTMVAFTVSDENGNCEHKCEYIDAQHANQIKELVKGGMTYAQAYDALPE